MLKFKALPFVFLAFSFQASAVAADIPWSAVDDAETQQMSCSDLKPPTEKEMMAFLESKITDPDEKIRESAWGLNLEDTPQMLRWFRGVHDLGPSSRRDIENARLKNLSCRSVVCALEKNYGTGMGLRMLYIYAKFGLPTSSLLHVTPSNYQNWKARELDDILVGLESLPPNKLPLKGRYILRFLDGYTLSSYKLGPGKVVLANARMDFFDHWAQQTRLERIQTVIHELGHVLAGKLDDSDAWKTLPESRVSKYAQTNPAEDFAESLTAYRIAPRRLKKISPERYEFIKTQVFSGLEFKTSKECEAPFVALEQETAKVFKMRRDNAEWIQKNQSGIVEELARVQKYGVLEDVAMKYCGVHFLAETYGGDREKTMECLGSVYLKRAAIVESRENGREEISYEIIQRNSLRKMSVPRSALLALREQMRNKIASELRELYSQRNLALFDKMEEAKLILGHTKPEDSEFIQGHYTLIKPLILKAFEQQQRGSFLQKLFPPNFQKLLP